jgi:hypothetical protein
MPAIDIHVFIPRYLGLQSRLIRAFLDQCKPRDLVRFRGVPPGSLELDGTKWNYSRHGGGILFLSEQGIRVNAHAASVQFPEGFDGGRLFEYLESLKIGSVCFGASAYQVGKREMDALLIELARVDLVQEFRSSGPFSHLIYQWVGPRAGDPSPESESTACDDVKRERK